MCIRNLCVELRNNALRAGDQIPGLRLIIINGANYLLYVGQFCLREGLEQRVGFEEVRRDLVYLLVGALRGEHDRYEELIFVLEVQL